MANLSAAREGYHVRLKIPDVKDTMVYLVHYYGKTLPTIYKRDSAHIDKNGVALFDSKDSTFVGGIYMRSGAASRWATGRPSCSTSGCRPAAST